MRRRLLVLCAILVAGSGCGEGVAPQRPDPSTWDEAAWANDRRARAGAEAVARAAYYFMLAHPDRTDATLEEVVATRENPEQVYVAAERARSDPWGRELRLTFEAPYVILATSAGPDRTFGTADDVWFSTRGWQ